MTELQQKLYDELQVAITNLEGTRLQFVNATNALAEAIQQKEEHYDASFPPDLERKIDHFANLTGWIYSRLEQGSRRDTNKKIRKAMGYSG